MLIHMFHAATGAAIQVDDHNADFWADLGYARTPPAAAPAPMEKDSVSGGDGDGSDASAVAAGDGMDPGSAADATGE